MATQLQVVNTVLSRLREKQVNTTADTIYATVISNFVHDTRREVEDAYNWNSLRTTIALVTTANIFEYSMTGIGERFKVIDVIGRPSVQAYFCNPVFTSQMTQWLLSANPAKGLPYYYSFNGLDNNGDTKVDIFPIPDNVYTINFNVVIPQPVSIADTTPITVPSHVIVLGALAKAYQERGESGSSQFQIVQDQYIKALETAISQEESYLPYETDWVPV